MSGDTPTQAELPGLVTQALTLVEQRLSGGSPGSGLYPSVRAQLHWIQQVLSDAIPYDPERGEKLLLGVYAEREFETVDPELADLLFAVEYLFVRRYPPRPYSPPASPAPPAP